MIAGLPVACALAAGATTLGIARPARRLTGIGVHPAAGGDPVPSGSRRLARLVPFVAGAATLVFLIVGRFSIMVAVASVVATLAYIVDATHTRRRSRRAEATLIVLLGHVVADLKAGALIGAAFSRAASDLPESTPPEIADTLKAVTAHVHRGGSAHHVLARRPELAGIARMWSVAESHGLSAAQMLDQARTRLSARASHRNSTTASLQGPQATAGILAFLPLVGIGLGTSMGADPAGLLFGGGTGGVLLVVGTALLCGGVLLSAWIIDKASP